VLAGGAEPPGWERAGTETYESDAVEAVRRRYAEARELTLARPA
jgi:xylulokinase